MQSSSSIYTVSELLPNLWAIDENGEDTIYLIAGKERALLIDTGWGLGDLAELVASLTPLPLHVVNTHGHPDHVCGNGQFDIIHIHPKDLPLLQGNFFPENRRRMLQDILETPKDAGFSENSWVNMKLGQIIPVAHGFTFDLGGRIIEVIETPGHSPGSICFWENQEQLLFTGDCALQGQIWLHLNECPPLSIFQDSIARLQRMVSPKVSIFPAHGRTPLTSQLLDELSTSAQQVLQGEARGIPFNTFLGPGLFHRTGSTGILYRDDNLYKKD